MLLEIFILTKIVTTTVLLVWGCSYRVYAGCMYTCGLYTSCSLHMYRKENVSLQGKVRELEGQQHIANVVSNHGTDNILSIIILIFTQDVLIMSLFCVYS